MSLKVIKACLLDYCVAKLHAVNEKNHAMWKKNAVKLLSIIL